MGEGRGLKPEFLRELKGGVLAPLIQRVKIDKDLDFQIRENYINIYYKGNSLLHLDGKRYEVKVDQKFSTGLEIPAFLNDRISVNTFLKLVPLIKENIILSVLDGKKENLEAEYEQLIIRANNLEKKNTSEYFIVDRQYQVKNEQRMDLTGFFWPSKGRRREQVVPLTFFELKYALNDDIKELHEQLEKYYSYVKLHGKQLAEEYQAVFSQKLELGLIAQDTERIEALKTLKFSADINSYQFVIILADYNPNSTLLQKDLQHRLSFGKQVKIFRAGYAIWSQYLESLGE